MQQGWISLHRKITEHPFYQEKRKFSKFEAWIDLLLLANHKDNKVLFGNEIIEVERGSFITSKRKLMERWGWSNTKVETYLNLLVTQGMIVQKSDTKKTVITIVNYDFYQGDSNKKRHETDAKTPRNRTNNNDNNVNNENKNKISRKSAQRIYEDDSDEMILVNYFIEQIRKNDPKFKEPNKQTWADTFRLLMNKDERDKREIAKLIKWVQQNEFWKSNVLSPTSLRKNYSTLIIQMNTQTNKQQPTTHNEPSPNYQEATIDYSKGES